MRHSHSGEFPSYYPPDYLVSRCQQDIESSGLPLLIRCLALRNFRRSLAKFRKVLRLESSWPPQNPRIFFD
jgi:hypothetical protein